MTLPRDFLNEVETEIEEARDHLAQNHDRLTALEDLHAVTVAVVVELGRPVTVFDVIRSARELDERARRAKLVRNLRTSA